MSTTTSMKWCGAAVALIPGVDERSISVVTARRDVTYQSQSSEPPAPGTLCRPSLVKARALTPCSKSSPSECPTCVRRNAGPTSPVTDRGRSCEPLDFFFLAGTPCLRPA